MKLVKIIIIMLAFGAISAFAVRADSLTLQIISIVSSSVVGAAVASAYELIDTHGQGIKIWFLSQIKYRKKDIRLSFSYLYRIEVDGKFLLVRGSKMKDRYQPVGGVYKFYPEARQFLSSIDYVPDTRMNNDDETDDLRIQIKGKNLLKFFDWFISMENREYDPTREFYEELLRDGTLPKEKFMHLKYRKVKIHNDGITWSEYLNINEVLYAEIFEVSLNDEQKQLVRQAIIEHPEKLCLATADEMRCRRYDNSVETNIGTNAKWLLGE